MSTHYDDIDAPAKPRRSLLSFILPPLICFLCGVAVTAWLVTHSSSALSMLGVHQQQAAPAAMPHPTPVPPPPSPDREGDGQARAVADPEMARRVASLEDQVARIEGQARSAAGDADRAEGMLIAFAARRALDRGIGLGYLEGLLRDRFGAGHPQEVATVIATSRQPVTLQALQDELQQIGPQLAGGGPKQSWWSAVRAELATLIIIRKSDTPSPEPQVRLDTISRLIDAGQVSHARAEVERMPGQGSASKWLADARRYVAARNALDTIESAALLGTQPPGRAAPAPNPAVPPAVASQPKSPLAAPGGA